MHLPTIRVALVALTLLGGGLAAAGFATVASAATVVLGQLHISGGFSRATLPNAPVGSGYLTIINAGQTADRLLGATTPVAGAVHIHEMKMEGDLMKMSHLPDGLEIPAGATVTLAPGKLHLMFTELRQPLVQGTTIPLTLNFEKAGSVEVELDVGGPGAKAPAETSSSHGG